MNTDIVAVSRTESIITAKRGVHWPHVFTFLGLACGLTWLPCSQKPHRHWMKFVPLSGNVSDEENLIYHQIDSTRIRSSAQIGFWTAIVFTVLPTAFNITYLVMVASTARDIWIDAATYASSFQVKEGILS